MLKNNKLLLLLFMFSYFLYNHKENKINLYKLFLGDYKLLKSIFITDKTIAYKLHAKIILITVSSD